MNIESKHTSQSTMKKTHIQIPLSKKDQSFLDQAAIMAEKSTMLMKHGCIIVSNNRIVGRGCNSYRTQFNDNFIGNSCSCHAEMEALRMVLKNNKKQFCSKSKVRKRVGQREESQCKLS